jgi:hypothetical protein
MLVTVLQLYIKGARIRFARIIVERTLDAQAGIHLLHYEQRETRFGRQPQQMAR